MVEGGGIPVENGRRRTAFRALGGISGEETVRHDSARQIDTSDIQGTVPDEGTIPQNACGHIDARRRLLVLPAGNAELESGLVPQKEAVFNEAIGPHHNCSALCTVVIDIALLEDATRNQARLVHHDRGTHCVLNIAFGLVKMAIGNGRTRGHHSRTSAIAESRRMFPEHQAGKNVPRIKQQEKTAAFKLNVFTENNVGGIPRQAIDADAFEEKQSRRNLVRSVRDKNIGTVLREAVGRRQIGSGGLPGRVGLGRVRVAVNDANRVVDHVQLE